MTDAQRSRIMRQVKCRNTRPELVVRRLLSQLGYRYRLHRKDLPCKPDIVFIGRRKVIFVNGCFWHGHDCKRGARMPKTNVDYWQGKISRNRERDKACYRKLVENGWDVLVVWECEIRDLDALAQRLNAFLN